MLSLYRPDYNPLRREYWFGQVDSRPLGAFRIVLGLLLLKDAIYHFFIAGVFYSDAGFTPRWALQDGMMREWRFSLMDAMPYAWMAQVFFALWVIVLILFTVGCRTRLMTILQFLFIVSVHERNVYVLNGADTVFRVLSFWSMFLPLGQYYSIDALRERWKRYGRSHYLPDLRADPGPRRAYAFPLRMIQLQFALIYLFTAWLKLPGAAWREGNAIYYALQLQSLTLPTGDFLLANAPMWLLRLMSYQSIITEWVFFFFVFLPFGQPLLRAIALILGAMLHIGIAATMSIENFSTVMIGAYLLYFEPAWIEWIDRTLRRVTACSTLPLPQGVSPLWGLLAAATPDQVVAARGEARPEEGPYDWWIFDEQGRRLAGKAAWLRAAGHLPGSRVWAWLLRIEPLRRFGWRLLRGVIAREAPPEPDPAAEPLPEARLPDHAGRVGLAALTGLLGALLLFIVWWNLTTVDAFMARIPPTYRSVPEVPRRTIQVLGIWQAWDMFSPFPSTVDGWTVTPGRFEDGRVIDLSTGQPVTTEFRRWFWGPGVRWKKYESNLSRNDYEPLLRAWGSYYCKLYNVEMRLPPGQRLATLEIHFYRYRSHAPGQPPNPLEDIMMWKHWCYPEYEY